MTGLRLRDDAYYAPTTEGVCVLTNSGEVVLTGPSIFQWIDRLAPYLDGSHTLTELTATLPAERRSMVERVITALHERGVIVEAGDETGPAAALTDRERRLYRREIRFLGYFGPSAERSFAAYRGSVPVLVGAGRMLLECVEAALCCGSRRLRVVVTGESPTEVDALAERERRARRRDPSQRITRVVADAADEERLSGAVGGAGVVVYACDRASADQARALDRACARAGVPFVAAVLAGDEAWLGPFGPAGGPWPGWTGAWRRLLALAPADAGAGERSCADADGDGAAAPPAGDPSAGAAPTVLANQVMREVVRLLSGTAEPAGQARMTRVDLQSLRADSHPFVPHPFALPAARREPADLLATVSRLRAGEPLDAEDFSRRVAACLQPRTGVLGEVTEGDFAQIPLAVSQVPVSDPVGLLGARGPVPLVTGAGLSLADARRAAVLRGLAAYGSLMVDPRRLHGGPGGADPRTGEPAEDLAALLAGRWTGFTWGYGLADDLAHPVAAAAVFPALRGVRPGNAGPAGAAAGYGWAEAIRRGLIGRCRRLTLAEIAEGGGPYTPIAWDEAALDAHGDRFRSLVKIAGRLDVYDVTGSPGVPTLAFLLGGATVAYASGFSFGEALRDGLAEVLLSYQSEANRQPGYAPPGVPALPRRGRLSRVADCPAWSTDEAATADRLSRLGWAAVAVPLDHDPGVTASIMPYLVNVVLTRA